MADIPDPGNFGACLFDEADDKRALGVSGEGGGCTVLVSCVSPWPCRAAWF
jgi:hypothetical protein